MHVVVIDSKNRATVLGFRHNALDKRVCIYTFLSDLLSTGVRSKVVKGLRMYRLFAGVVGILFMVPQ